MASQETVSRAPRHVHHLSNHQHYRYDNSLEPALTITSGETVVIECLEAADGQFSRTATVGTIKGLDWTRIHSLTGPIAVQDAEPGNVLQVEILEIDHEGWGWTGILPEYGLLADDFGSTYALRVLEVGPDGRLGFADGIRVPVAPFMGEMGVAPREPGAHSTMPPTRVGGNLDSRHTGVGTTLYFPIEVEGALFSTGDGHLAQGDGEVSCFAAEAPLTLTARLTARSDLSVPAVQYVTRGPTTSRTDGMGSYVTTWAGPDLHEDAQNAVRRMIALLGERYGLTSEDAYMLCSLAGDLKISVPVLGVGHEALVTFHVPKSIFSDC